MKQSLTYYITLLVIRLKGLKKNFSLDPIDYKKIRKGDVHHPGGKLFKQNKVRTFKVSNSVITEIERCGNSKNLLLFIHGGAFISGPAQHHWDAIKEIATQTSHTIWMCSYPKAPESNISEISANIDSIYKVALENYRPTQISLIGDSVGGTLVTALTQRLVKKGAELPSKIILISPVMDASMSNPEIEKLDAVDPILSKAGVLSAKRMCAETHDLKNVMISPLYGSFEQFPKTILYIADKDITYPDQKLAIEKCIDAKVDIEIIEGKKMPHIWPLLPVMKEAKVSLNNLISKLND
ncbi:alpha/beta hydrolase fold domain-containing protein [Pontibacter sp. MBLB2868]|uniref:alpha/beta hydrolase fold domain-containing protein n=1 Tax=Pontibacter sp. MBLB2868 TaxID=3451555 RepID=UPI003F74B54D